MSSSSSDEVDEYLEEMVDEVVDNFIDSVVDGQANNPKRRAYIERNRERGHNQLLTDYFNESPHTHQKSIRMLAYGQSGDTYDEYLRLGESTARLCLENFTTGIIQLFGQEYLRRPNEDDLQRLLDIGEHRLYALGVKKLPNGFERLVHTWFRKADNCLRSCCITRSLDMARIFRITRSSTKSEVQGQEHTYRMAYYLTDGIYPNWSKFIQSIPLPQGPKAELFAERQESTRKDIERTFGVLQSRFAIVKNPALLWDKEKI
uniref:Uncharacterized protein n=1 Tax=Brassica oleracea var. oleracea TaxID=109376 RepID=A0A0D3BJN8_BRAOL